MLVPFRNGNSATYRYGFNGMEKDDEVKGGDGNYMHFEFRDYDPRIGRFKSIDPDERIYAYMSPYVYAANDPIWFIDEAGRGPIIPESWWRGKGYNVAFIAGVVDGLWDTTVTAVNLQKISPMYMFSHPVETCVNGVDLYKKGKALFKVATDGETRKMVLESIKESIGTWAIESVGGKGVDVAGYNHGKLVFEVLLALVGAEEINLLLKTGKFSLNVVSKIGTLSKLERTMVQKNGIWKRLVDLPLQQHHLLTKYGDWAKKFNKVLKKYDLDLEGEFNKIKVHHQGPHPGSYHQSMYEKLLKIDKLAKGNKDEFLKLFKTEIKDYVNQNQDVLHKTTEIIKSK